MPRYKLNYLDTESGFVYAKTFYTLSEVHKYIIDNDIIMYVLINLDKFEVVDL